MGWFMHEWQTMRIPGECILYTTSRAVLIGMPLGCEYEGFKFWHPEKLSERVQFCHCDIIYKDNFIFKLFKDKKDKGRKREIIETIEVSPECVRKIFEEYGMKDTHIPQKIEPEKTEAIKELLDE